MLTYENVVTLLLSASERQQLNIVLSQEQLDTHALVRTFMMTCLPRGTRDPNAFQPRVTVSFRWDPALTTISIIGSEGICDLYHAPDQSCPHADVGCAYDAMLEIEATYQIPIPEEHTEDIASVVGLAASTRDLLASTVDSSEDLEVRVQLVFDSGGASVSQLEAIQRWLIDDDLHEAETLGQTFAEICAEVAEALEALAGHEPPPPSLGSERDHDDLGDHLTYLRPPTA
ncbi:MAG: hypothetical protein KatS3mg057_0942 [Herpetosiphonaceae bacterium]|nr:MAG: hypothetical protein KatS3mg057_0942 [Herpetosiphonaceae bacterium]